MFRLGGGTVSLLLCLGLSTSQSPNDFPICVNISNLVGSPLPAARDLFYVSRNISYMNTGTLGPMPKPALECAVEAWKYLEGDPVNRYPWGSTGEELDDVREVASNIFSCSISEIVLLQSTTVALNTVAEGLVASGTFQSGDSVLITDQEHPGGVAAWEHWQDIGLVDSIDKVAIPYGENATKESVIAAFDAAFKAASATGRRYRVVFASHVLTTTGLRLPLTEIASIVHSYGAFFIVDGAQAPGGISVNLTASGADVYTISAHKWLLAPTGSGLLYIRTDAQPAVSPTYLSAGYNAYTAATGTLPLQTVAGLSYVFDFFAAFGGLEVVEKYNTALRERTYEYMQVCSYETASHLNYIYMRKNFQALVTKLSVSTEKDFSGFEIISPPSISGLASPILSINLPPAVISASDCASRLLTQYGVVVKLLPDFEGGNTFQKNSIRISHHLFNSEIDVLKLINGLSSLLLE